MFFLNLVTLFFLTLSQVAGARHHYSICAIIYSIWQLSGYHVFPLPCVNNTFLHTSTVSRKPCKSVRTSTGKEKEQFWLIAQNILFLNKRFQNRIY